METASTAATRAAGILTLVLLGACTTWPLDPIRENDAPLARARQELELERQRADRSERRVERLQADLGEAEQTLIDIESGLLAHHTRADAVSSLADVRILVERAEREVPWRPAEIREARAKLEEADRHVGAGNFGSAIFFTSRARRIAEMLISEAKALRARPNVRFVTGRRVNLRAAPSKKAQVLQVLRAETPVFAAESHRRWVRVQTPSGQLGWVFETLLRNP
ncbi:MAG: SH3 domain-containing protein [Myxococcota bacterium]